MIEVKGQEEFQVRSYLMAFRKKEGAVNWKRKH